LLGNGNGTFRPPLDFPTANPSNGYVAVGYFNADGFQDVAVLGNSGISVFLGNGNGTFQAPLFFDTGVSSRRGKRSLAIGDFNGDGSQDLVATNVTSFVSVLLGNGDGTFQAPLIFNAGGSGPTTVYSLGAGDFNNDHVQDLAVGTDLPFGGLSVLLGNGNGTFRMPSFFGLGSGYGIGSIAVGDFNSDGIHDLILGAAGPRSTGLWVLVGNGDATFQTPVNVGVGSSGASFAIGLLSGDGRPDIAVGGCVVAALADPIRGDGYICSDKVSVLINNTP
jgi:FG-GAP-like repeat